MAHRFTIGVEEEFQIVDPSSGKLRSHLSELIAAASPGMGEQIKPELHQSIVEMGTRICENVEELRGELLRTRGELMAAAERVGLQVAAAGTHPFSSWIDQVISPGERYERIAEGTSAERQLRVYRETNDLKVVVRHLVEETRAGVGRQVSTAAGAN